MQTVGIQHISHCHNSALKGVKKEVTRQGGLPQIRENLSDYIASVTFQAKARRPWFEFSSSS